ncbi:MAG: asparagine synthase (glutamine-hydrolyzing) [Pirellulaceae bacterium]
MCGITGGVWTDDTKRLDAATLDRMTDALTHRGPDDRGTFLVERGTNGGETRPGCGLGFRRLSIIDLQTGHQPLCNETEDVWVAFNGEIYNFVELRKRLQGAGHRFKTETDTEVLVHLYEDLGEQLFEQLNGMFAIAIWDQKHGRLLLGRDRFGKKPLYYAQQSGRLVFGSELKSLVLVPGLERSIDPRSLDEYLTYQYVPHPNSIYREVRKIPPGCWLSWTAREMRQGRFWEPAWGEERDWSLPDAERELVRLFEDAVRVRLRSDVPLGAFLSGGIDSSLIAAAMVRQAKQGVKTFSIGFPHPDFDESAHARVVAEALGTEHHEFSVTPRALELLPKLVEHYDEPFADSSAIPTFYLAEQTKAHVTVALSGDGGDELFGGYERYQAVRLGAWLDRTGPVKWLAANRLWQALPAGGRQRGVLRRWRRFAEAAACSPERRYLLWMSIFDETRRAGLYRPEFIEQLDSDPADFLVQAWRRSAPRDAVARASLADMQTYLPCDLMTKVDIASMAHGLECRQPFLDFRLAEFAIGLPTRWKLRGRQGKWLLRRAFADWLPDSIWRRKKMGFGVPLAPWFRQELRDLLESSLGQHQARIYQWLRPEAVRELIDQHQKQQFDHSYRLWSLLMLELWLQRWMVE